MEDNNNQNDEKDEIVKNSNSKRRKWLETLGDVLLDFLIPTIMLFIIRLCGIFADYNRLYWSNEEYIQNVLSLIPFVGVIFFILGVGFWKSNEVALAVLLLTGGVVFILLGIIAII